MHNGQVIYYRRSHWAMLENIAGFEHYFAYCAKNLPPTFVPWRHSTTPALVGLEYFGAGTMLPHAQFNARVGIGMLVRVAQTAFPIVAAAGGKALAGAAFFADDDIGNEPGVDGAPLETQLATLMAWLEQEAEVQAVDAVFDRTRQLYVWDDDIRPLDDQAFMWLTEVGQCACAAVINPGGDATDRGYYGWPADVCVGRGLVAAVRAVTPPGSDVTAIYNQLFTPLQEKPTKPKQSR